MFLSLRLRNIYLLTLLSMGACSSHVRVSESQTPAASTSENKTSTSDAGSHQELMAPQANTPAKSEAHASPATHDSGATHHVAEGVDPDTSLGWLKNGNIRFLKKHFRSDGRSAKDRQRLSTGQKPHAIILSCSDSRVPPEHVFDQALGEIFVIRVAGEALDSSAIASIEYAVEHLGSRLIIVMGHESCGAVKAAITTPEGSSAGSPSLDKLVADIRPRISKVVRQPVVSDVLVESTANAKGVAQDLVLRSQILKNKIASGDIKIVPALYHLSSGVVDFF